MDWQTFFTTYGYLALFVILLIEGQPFIIFGGFLAAQGYLKLEWVILIGWPALFIGDFIFHQIALKGGRRILLKYHRFLLLSLNMIEKLEQFFSRHNNKVIFFSKFIYGLGRNILIVAGLLGRPFKNMIKSEVIGCLLSMIIFSVIGYLLGNSYTYLNGVIKGFGIVAIALIVIILILERLKVRRLLFKNNNFRDSADKI